MNEISSRAKSPATASRIAIAPLDDISTFKDRAYAALKDVIVSLDVYDGPNEVRLDERRLAQDLGVAARRCAKRWRNSSAKVSCARCPAAASMSCARPSRK